MPHGPPKQHTGLNLGFALTPVPLIHVLSSTPHLPGKLQRELYFSRWDLEGRELAKSTHRGSTAVERLKVVQRWREVGAIEDIEELSSELNIEIFRDFGNFGVLNHREIHVDQPWPDDGVAPQVAEKVDTRWESETLVTVHVVKVLVRGPGIDEACRINVLEAAVTPG